MAMTVDFSAILAPLFWAMTVLLLVTAAAIVAAGRR
jgi:hypothetical protein